jgi:hypothetical protein
MRSWVGFGVAEVVEVRGGGRGGVEVGDSNCGRREGGTASLDVGSLYHDIGTEASPRDVGSLYHDSRDLPPPLVGLT